MPDLAVVPGAKDESEVTASRHDDRLADMADRRWPLGLNNRVRFDHGKKRWHYWDKVIWRPDGTGRVYELLRECLNVWMRGTQSKEVLTDLAHLLNLAKKKSVMESLSYRDGIAMKGDEWDPDPYLLGAPNGVIDLRTGQLIKGQHPELLVSRAVRYAYDPDSDPRVDCPLFLRFLSEITAGDLAGKGRYLLRIFGYALFGLQTEQKFWLFTGGGNNGKGVLTKTVAHIMGDYAGSPSATLYMRTKYGSPSSAGPRADLLNLQGLRFTPISEPEGGAFNDELLKAHTGDDPIRARGLHSGVEIEFRPTHTIVVATNQPPRVEDVGKSMQRRVRVVPFTEDFSGARMDRDLETKLRAEGPGILALLVHAAQDWYEDGLCEPEVVTSASQAYIEDNDPLSEFVYACCVVEAGATMSGKLAHTEYTDWARKTGSDLLSASAFGSDLSRRFRKTRLNTGVQYLGIRLKNAAEEAREAVQAG